jgi:TRAP-type mannitol/chloroaromatic compound transport system substrate-binding protein
MKRKEFLKNGLIAGVAGGSVLAACNNQEAGAIEAPAIITDKRFKWKMVTTWAPNSPVVGEGCVKLAEWITKMSGGRIEIQTYGGGELVPPLEVFEAVSSGAAEMGHGASYYWAGVEPALQFFTSVPFGMNAQQMTTWLECGGGQQLWEELYANFNIVPFFAGNTGVQMGGWFNRKIETITDFQGLKMRMPGLGGDVLEKIGATVVLSAGSELYTNLERGVIDATEWIGPYHDYLMGFHNIAKYYYYPGWHEAGSVLECIINKRNFDQLSDDLKEIVRTAMYRSNVWIMSEFESKNNEYLKKIREESDVEILNFPSEVLKRLKEVTLEIYSDLIAKDEWSKRVYSSFSSFKRDITQWSDISEKQFYTTIH